MRKANGKKRTRRLPSSAFYWFVGLLMFGALDAATLWWTLPEQIHARQQAEVQRRKTYQAERRDADLMMIRDEIRRHREEKKPLRTENALGTGKDVKP